MKKTVLFTIFSLIFLWLVLPSSHFESQVEDFGAVFKLPASIVIVEDEAFEGTSVEKVILPEKLTDVRERAFADNRALTVICIPESVTFIADDAFDGNSNLIIQGLSDSYAAHWANEHNIAFAPTETLPLWIQKVGRLLRVSMIAVLRFNSIDPAAFLWRRRRNMNAERSMRPQDRPELHPIDYRFP